MGLIVNPLSLKKLNMFEHMKIAESIYEVVVEPSYKKTTRKDANRSGISRKMG